MPLKVEVPLGSSPLTEAIVRVVEEINGFSGVLIGPAVCDRVVPDWSCVREDRTLRVIVPIANGFRVLMLTLDDEQSRDSSSLQQLMDVSLVRLRRAHLPEETADTGTGVMEQPAEGSRTSRVKKPRTRRLWMLDQLPIEPSPTIPKNEE